MNTEPLVVVLGSGVSVPSGMPSVSKLTSELFEPMYRRPDVAMDYAAGFYPDGDGEQPSAHQVGYAATCQLFLQRLLRDVDESASRAGYLVDVERIARDLGDIEPELGGGAARARAWAMRRRELEASGGEGIGTPSGNYEDLLYLCTLIENVERGTLVSPQVSAYAEDLRRSEKLVPAHRSASWMSDLAYTAIEARLLILSVVKRMLGQTPNKVVGLDLLVDLYKADWVSHLTIVTFNHDVLAEHVFEQEGIAVQTGFGPEFDPQTLLSPHPDGTVRLIKLHGSVDWRYARRLDDTSQVSTLVRVDPGEADRSSTVDGLDGGRYRVEASVPHILTGGNKESLYNEGVFGHLQDAFQQVLAGSNRLLVSGFGWNDKGATNRIERWLEREGNTCVYAHRTPVEALEASAWGKGLDISFPGRKGRFVPVESFLQDLSENELRRQYDTT